MPPHSTGNRKRSVNASHPWVGRYGWMTRRFGIWSTISLVMPRITVATIAPGPESVSVEMHTPMAAIPDTPRRMYPAAARIRSDAWATESVVPDSVGSGLNPNTTPPQNAPHPTTHRRRRPRSAMAAPYLPRTSRVRATGRTRR